MRRTSIKPKRIYELAQEYLSDNKIIVSHPYGGRPRDYDDALILTIACIQNLHQFSFREALEFCGDIFPELPTLSTYHYRLSKIPPDTAQGFVAYLGEKSAKSKWRIHKNTLFHYGRHGIQLPRRLSHEVSSRY